MTDLSPLFLYWYTATNNPLLWIWSRASGKKLSCLASTAYAFQDEKANHMTFFFEYLKYHRLVLGYRLHQYMGMHELLLNQKAHFSQVSDDKYSKGNQNQNVWIVQHSFAFEQLKSIFCYMPPVHTMYIHFLQCIASLSRTFLHYNSPSIITDKYFFPCSSLGNLRIFQWYCLKMWLPKFQLFNSSLVP